MMITIIIQDGRWEIKDIGLRIRREDGDWKQRGENNG